MSSDITFFALPSGFLKEVIVDSNNIFEFACISQRANAIANEIFSDPSLVEGIDFKERFVVLLKKFSFSSDLLPPYTKDSFNSLQLFNTLYQTEKKAQPEGVTKINIAGRDLSSIPTALLTLKDLETLNLSHNPIRHIPDEFNRLSKLKTLFMSHMQVAHLPVQGLKNLQELRMSACHIDIFPQEILHLPIETLVLANNEIKNLPEELGQMTALKVLDLSRNRIKYLPKNLGNLSELTSLNLSENQIEMLPMSMSKLRILSSAVLESNPLGQPLENGDSLMDYLGGYSPLVDISLNWTRESVKEDLKFAFQCCVETYSSFKMFDYRTMYKILSKTIQYPGFFQEDSAPWFEITKIALAYASPLKE